MVKEEYKDIIEKYRSKIEEHIDSESTGSVQPNDMKNFSKEYLKFREEALSKSTTTFEEWCNKAENIFKVKPNEKTLNEVKEAIDTAHLNVTPDGVASLSALSALSLITFGLLLSGTFLLLTGTFPIFTFLMFLILALLALIYLNKMPVFLATKWRLNASNQMVITILYIVIYMRHTSNLEHTI
jgi:ASC-1-like (ASCH) protein